MICRPQSYQDNFVLRVVWFEQRSDSPHGSPTRTEYERGGSHAFQQQQQLQTPLGSPMGSPAKRIWHYINNSNSLSTLLGGQPVWKWDGPAVHREGKRSFFNSVVRMTSCGEHAGRFVVGEDALITAPGNRTPYIARIEALFEDSTNVAPGEGMDKRCVLKWYYRCVGARPPRER